MYVKLLTPIAGISSSQYWTWSSSFDINGFKLYATNTDPSTMGDVHDTANWTEINTPIRAGYVDDPLPHKYIGFYGVPYPQPTNHAVAFSELVLTTTDGITINHTNKDTYITSFNLVKGVWNSESNTSTIMDGNTSYVSPFLTFSYNEPSGTNTSAIYFYMEMVNPISINGGTYYSGSTTYYFNSGKIYGTNTNPTTFIDSTDVSNWTEVCDLTKS